MPAPAWRSRAGPRDRAGSSSTCPWATPSQPGDLFRIHPGCDKRLDTCIDRFANVLNFRGEPYIPGQDLLMSYPDAR